MEKQIIISLDEYNKLIAENKRMKKILDAKEVVVGIKSISIDCGMGYFRDTWNVMLENELIGPMAVRIRELEDKAFEDLVKIRTLKSKNKKWF